MTLTYPAFVIQIYWCPKSNQTICLATSGMGFIFFGTNGTLTITFSQILVLGTKKLKWFVLLFFFFFHVYDLIEQPSRGLFCVVPGELDQRWDGLSFT